eukprot:CAMPEP_0177589222 /NCGR_PEP_ID=MMETSP0419_2-20121207/6678_1 /TAXON_ID=582737 /ORGANISM="Tetraselmis sp., Strain GSL018" /LENGTH=159 /DNA_ID=CAMNT_0019079541 /DNA_START=199 /DNA_END=674 /DNA_ORIENTATION=-
MGSIEEIQRARRLYLPQNLKVQYESSWNPGLHILKGEGCFLIDASGTLFLDCVNNVANVGHCESTVTTNISNQLYTLNTNTRYLGAQLPAYAEKLTQTMPEPLQVVYLTCSGSEANDLALRMVKASSKPGAVHIAVLGSAYHGHTLATLGISPYKFEVR